MTKRKKPADKVKVGRKTQYRIRFNDEVFMLCLLGAIDEQIAEAFGVSETTINNWKLQHPTFLESMKRGKVQADGLVARALFSRAIGYQHIDTKMFCFEGEILSEEYMKYYPPDTAACFIWLKNRAGWKDKQEHEHGIAKETLDLLRMIDGKSKGQLPDAAEGEDAG